MSRHILYTPLRDALMAAGVKDLEDRMLYQDYLNIVAGTDLGRSIPPITEQQWEQMCDMLSNTRPLYSSTVKSMLSNLERKAAKAA